MKSQPSDQRQQAIVDSKQCAIEIANHAYAILNALFLTKRNKYKNNIFRRSQQVNSYATYLPPPIFLILLLSLAFYLFQSHATMPTILDWSPRFPSTSTNIITCNSSCCCSSSNNSFLYNTLVNLEIYVEKKRMLKVESQCKTVQYTLPISSSAAADADKVVLTILLLSQSTYDRRRPIFLPPSGDLTVLQPSYSSSCDYCHCRFFFQIQSWMSDALRKMPILSPLAVSHLSPRIADIFLNGTKEAASRGHDPDQYFDLWLSVQVEETSATVKIERCCECDDHRHKCSICLEECSVAMKMPCSHAFHCPCILNWFNTGKTTCPICRFQFWT
ncbi:hypothetical protein ACLOJK_041474 [Asimina triloba]